MTKIVNFNRTAMMPQPKILVARLSSLGDIILTAPVYRNLKTKWPNSHIAVLVKKQFAPAVSGHPCVDEVICFDGLFKTILKIRRGGFTHFLDLHGTLRTSVISAFCGISKRARYKKDSFARRLFVGLKVPSPALCRHTLERYLQSLDNWDVPIVYSAPELSDLNHEKKPQKLSRIAVLQTAFLGDAVLTLPMLGKMAELFPSAEISVFCRPQTAEIFKSCPSVGNVIIDDKKGRPFLRSFFGLVGNLRAGGFDAVVSAHRSFRSALAAYLSKTPVRVGFDKSAGRIFFNRIAPFSWLLHDAERNLSLLNALGFDETGKNFRAAIKAPPGESILKKLKSAGVDLSRPVAAVHPGSIWFTKRWPKERYAELVKKLCELGAQCVIIGGQNDVELGNFATAQAGNGAFNFCGKTDLPELMAAMAHFKLFITNDSGPMHIATAFNVPALAIFGPTTKELGFFPYGKGHRVLEAELKCRPCALHGGKKCPRGHFLCMKLITVEQVFSAAKEMLV
ncbi:MAG: lipopolysaccharide heptosyltransferase II [Elusimicrobia bacterium]|nr:lipopolysaccharide heptosyltransferase II [Elusimicrobiota bacterium]